MRIILINKLQMAWYMVVGIIRFCSNSQMRLCTAYHEFIFHYALFIIFLMSNFI
jgi:hypothetical protein